METLHSPWIKWRLIFHHWITNLTVGGLYKYTGEIWVIRSSKIQIWPSDQLQKNRWFFQKIGHISIKLPINRRFFRLLLRLLRACLHSRFFADLLVKHRYFADISMILLIFCRFFRRSIIGDNYHFAAARYPIFLRNIGNISRFFNPWLDLWLICLTDLVGPLTDPVEPLADPFDRPSRPLTGPFDHWPKFFCMFKIQFFNMN